MNLHELVNELIVNTKGTADGALFSPWVKDSSLGAFGPELVLCVTIVLMLFVRLFNFARRMDMFWIAAAGALAAFVIGRPWAYLAGTLPIERTEIFTGMLVYDPFTVFMRGVLVGFAFLFAIFTKLSGIPDREDSPDIYTLVLGSTLGMCLMASANHMLMVFMAVEMASVPSYALAGMLKGRRVGSEAALKYSIYGAGAAGVMLYGISLVAGLLHTAHLPTMAMQLSAELPMMDNSEVMVLVLGGLMVMVGLAFKLSAVPFHFWCPDVFEGAAAEVNAFLSVASKAGALALLVRVAIGFGAVPPEARQPGDGEVAHSATATERIADASGGLFAVAAEDSPSDRHEDEHHDDDHAASGHAEPPAHLDGLATSRDWLAKLIAFLAVITCTFGNLTAYGQTNIKRLLAYSTIAHAGYMMMAVPPMLVMASIAPDRAQDAVAALAIYIGVYLFMNLGAFAIVAFLRNAMHSEEIADYAGLIKRCPITVVCFTLILFSLVGLPPLAGFVGKFAIFASLADGYQVSSVAGKPAPYLMVVLVVAGINTAISLFYYLRVVRVMTIEEEPEDRRPFSFPELSPQVAYVVLLTIPTALLMLNWDGLSSWAKAAAQYLLTA